MREIGEEEQAIHEERRSTSRDDDQICFEAPLQPNAVNQMQKKREDVPGGLKLLMLAVSCKGTRIHYHHRHKCLRHDKIVDGKHIDECDLLRQNGKRPTSFNEVLD